MASFDDIIGRQHLFAWGSVWSIDMGWVGLTGGARENLLDTCMCSTSTSFSRSTFISVSPMDKEIVWSGNLHMGIFVKSSPSHVESGNKFMVSRRIISLISDVSIEIWWVVADVILENIFRNLTFLKKSFFDDFRCFRWKMAYFEKVFIFNQNCQFRWNSKFGTKKYLECIFLLKLSINKVIIQLNHK